MTAPLSADALRWRCDAADLDFETTDDVKPLVGVVGQDDAVEALRFGLETDAPGQNVFVRGLSGTGRMTLIQKLLEDIRPRCALTRGPLLRAQFRPSRSPSAHHASRGQRAGLPPPRGEARGLHSRAPGTGSLI